MDEWTEVTLSHGGVLRVRPLPSRFVTDRVAARIPLPRPPRVEVKSAVPGGTSVWVEKRDDPTFIEAWDVAIGKRIEAVQTAHWLYCVDIPIPPKGWRTSSGLEAILQADEWRSGADGDRLDYLEFALLQTLGDITAVMAVLNRSLAEAEQQEEVVAQIEESFRS